MRVRGSFYNSPLRHIELPAATAQLDKCPQRRNRPSDTGSNVRSSLNRTSSAPWLELGAKLSGQKSPWGREGTDTDAGQWLDGDFFQFVASCQAGNEVTVLSPELATNTRPASTAIAEGA